MRLWAFMVVRNESANFLTHAIKWAGRIADGVLVHDDGSTDDTVHQAVRAGAMVTRRGAGPSFLEHEGRFRSNALESFSSVLRDGDWIMVNDADEFWVGPDEKYPLRSALGKLIEQATAAHKLGVRIPIHTVWRTEQYGSTLVGPMLRTEITGKFSWRMDEPRLWKYREGVGFQDLAMGCRNAPADVYASIFEAVHPIAVLHYGLAKPAWRGDKHRRYTTYSVGHNPDWVESMLDSNPPLEPWLGCDPHARLGHKEN
jgi:hypothetical protein